MYALLLFASYLLIGKRKLKLDLWEGLWVHCRPDVLQLVYLSLKLYISRALNPYKPSFPFLGHRLTVQTQIRRRRTQRLIRVFTVCKQEYLFEIESK